MRRRRRSRFGLLPDTEAVFKEAVARVAARPKTSKRTRIEERLRSVRGVADGDRSTDEVMRLTRGEE